MKPLIPKKIFHLFVMCCWGSPAAICIWCLGACCVLCTWTMFCSLDTYSSNWSFSASFMGGLFTQANIETVFYLCSELHNKEEVRNTQVGEISK